MRLRMNQGMILLTALFMAFSGIVAFGQAVPDILNQYVLKTQAFQNSLVFGKEYRVEKNMLLMDGSKLRRECKVKVYDLNNWVIRKKMDGREFVIGRNESYLFLLEHIKGDLWKQMGAARKPDDRDFNAHFKKDFELLNPLVALNGVRFLDEFNEGENFKLLKWTKGDLNDLRFDYYDNRFKEEGYGPVQAHVEFYDNPFRYIVLYEKVLKNYKPEISFSSYRSVRMMGADTLDSIHVTNETKTISTNKMEQREVFQFSDFKPAEKLKDNYLGFYGIAEPAHLSAGTPWYLSYWSLGGMLFIFLGGLGFWIQRNRA